MFAGLTISKTRVPRQLNFRILASRVKFLWISLATRTDRSMQIPSMPQLPLRLFFIFMLLSSLGANAGPQPIPITITIHSAAPDSDQRIPFIELTLALPVPASAGGQPILKMPLIASNVVTAAKTIEGLTVTDASGPLDVTVKDDTEAGEATYRHWIANRATQGSFTIHYRVPITNVAAPRGAAPPLELRSDSAAFSGAGETFLILPESDSTQPLQLRWDLSAMPAGSVGVSSFGVGDLTSSDPKNLHTLQSSYFMAGKLGLYPATPPKTGFFSAWHGTAPFDLGTLMASEERLYSFYGKFFHRPAAAPYGVFLRANPVNAGGGMELSGSFIATFGPKTDLDDLKITLAHEMLHTFVGGLDQPEGLVSSWYSEGMAVYYARLLALRAGQINPDDFLKDLNTTAARYYTDALIDTPNSEIPARFWADTRIRVLPYDRGSMYFAVVDEEVRARSNGKRTLDDLLFAMLGRRDKKLPLDQAAWVDLVTQELGARGNAEFDAMLAGQVQLPEPGGFGPCFTRITRMLRRYQLGFEPRVLTEPKRIVRGLIAGSAAERAGIHDGDEITQPVPQDRIQGDQDGILTLKLLRDGKPLEISYLPRGEIVEAYQWTRNNGVADSVCVF
jgi:predicted metalloprotease with PDZ domain